jgi:hypothetical protein
MRQQARALLEAAPFDALAYSTSPRVCKALRMRSTLLLLTPTSLLPVRAADRTAIMRILDAQFELRVVHEAHDGTTHFDMQIAVADLDECDSSLGRHRILQSVPGVSSRRLQAIGRYPVHFIGGIAGDAVCFAGTGGQSIVHDSGRQLEAGPHGQKNVYCQQRRS